MPVGTRSRTPPRMADERALLDLGGEPPAAHLERGFGHVVAADVLGEQRVHGGGPSRA